MRAIAVAAALTFAACVPASSPHDTLPELYAKRERAHGNRVLSGVGIAVGLVGAIAGGMLAAHGADVRSRESSADDEGGIGSLLGGMLLCGGGSLIAISSGIGLGVYSHQYNQLETQIERTERISWNR